MLVRLLRLNCRLHPGGLFAHRARLVPQMVTVRKGGDYIPPTQYDIPFPKKMQLGTLLVRNWEIIPLFVTTAISMLIVIIAIAWACKNKVDVVFTTHSCNNISRTMDLRHPTVHKMLIINQRYKPWPEMQDVLDKMRVAERKALLRATACSFARE